MLRQMGWERREVVSVRVQVAVFVSLLGGGGGRAGVRVRVSVAAVRVRVAVSVRVQASVSSLGEGGWRAGARVRVCASAVRAGVSVSVRLRVSVSSVGEGVWRAGVQVRASVSAVRVRVSVSVRVRASVSSVWVRVSVSVRVRVSVSASTRPLLWFQFEFRVVFPAGGTVEFEFLFLFARENASMDSHRWIRTLPFGTEPVVSSPSPSGLAMTIEPCTLSGNTPGASDTNHETGVDGEGREAEVIFVFPRLERQGNRSASGFPVETIQEEVQPL